MLMLLFILSVILSLLVGAAVLIKGRNNFTNIALFALIVFMNLWNTIVYIVNSGEGPTLLLFRATFVIVVLVAMSVYYFSSSIVSGYKRGLKDKLIIPSVSLLMSVVALSPLNISTVSLVAVNDGFVVSPDRNIGYYFVVLWILALVFYSLSTLYFSLRESSPAKKSQIRVIIFGTVLALFSGLATNVVLPNVYGNTVPTSLSPLSTLVFGSVLAYAIIKHRFLDIRLVVARSLAYILAIGVVGAVYGYLVFGFVDQFFPATRITAAQQSIYTLLAVFLAFTFQPIKRFFDKFTDKIFYRDGYDSQEVLNRLGKVFVSKSNSFELLDMSLSVITDALKVEFGRLVVIDKGSIYKESHIGAYPDAEVDANDLARFSKQVNVLDELHDSDEKSVLHDMKAYILIRLTTQDNLIGYLILGYKQSGTIFTTQDINFLEILSQELAVAIQNAKSYEEIQAFSETLKKEVDEATAQLRETNKRLVKLDEAKDEFISMASHQLRTPLTTIKGYLSMLLDGDAGKIPKKQKEFIDLAFVSSQRMVHLISDMLNVSRISTGRLTIDKESLDLASVVESELEQLHRQAEAHGVELRLHRPDESIDIELDENKIRQVIMNFTDNAIYYSPEGTVDVTVEAKDGFAEFRVEDNGIGVSEEAQKQLFTKFFRAENAQAVRPDGTGLGLYMAKQVIEAQDGEIIFKSKEGKGSTFGFRFKMK